MRFVALGDAQHREAGLRVLAVARGALERIGGGGEVAAPELDLAELVPRLARRAPGSHRSSATIAARSSDSAPAQSPRSRVISARCIRQSPGKSPMPGRLEHTSACSVHSDARRMSPSA